MNDVYICSYPRSGSTLARLVLAHHFGYQAPSVYGQERVLGETALEITYGKQEHRSTLFWKTHHLPNEKWPVVLLVRNGLHAMVSLGHYDVDVTKNQKDVAVAIRDRISSNTWTTRNRHWLEDAIYVMKCESLMANPLVTIATMLKAIGLPSNLIREDPLPSFDTFREESPKFYRQKPAGWTPESEVPQDLMETFRKKHGPMMQRLGYWV